jgi:hypothetical protein
MRAMRRDQCPHGLHRYSPRWPAAVPVQGGGVWQGTWLADDEEPVPIAHGTKSSDSLESVSLCAAANCEFVD